MKKVSKKEIENKKDEPLVAKIVLNKYPIGEIQIYLSKLHDLLYKLHDDGEVKLFHDENEKELFLEKMRNTPPDEGEFNLLKAAFIKLDKANADLSDEQMLEDIISEFKDYDREFHYQRLLRRDVELTHGVIKENIDFAFTKLFTLILTAAQLRANKEIREEVDLPLLSKKQMAEEIKNIYNQFENIILDITQGGRNKGSKNLKTKPTFEEIKKEIKKFKGSNKFPTQSIIAKRLGVTGKTIQRRMIAAGEERKYTDFVHSIINS